MAKNKKRDRKPLGVCVYCGQPAYRRFRVTPELRNELVEDCQFSEEFIDQLLVLELERKQALGAGRSRAVTRGRHMVPEYLPACAKHLFRIHTGNTFRDRVKVLSDDEVRDIQRRHARGETIQAIAESLGMPYGTIWNRVHRPYRNPE